MAFYITTTGTLGTVPFDDLGERTFTHPTTNFNLESEYSIFELLKSADLQNAIDLGYITVSDAVAGGNTITDLEKYYMTKVVFDSNDDDIVDNASQLDGFSASYYTDAANLTGILPASVIADSGLVDSVNGKTGSVVLDTTDITEGDNQYYTNARARAAVGVSASSGNYLNYDSDTGLFSITALAITDVTVDSFETVSSDAYFGANYTGSEFQEGDTVVLASLTDGAETWMHNGGSAGTIADFVKIQSPNLSDGYIRSLVSATSPLTYEASTGVFSIPRANGSTSGYISDEDFSQFNSKIGGTGTANYISKFSASGTIADSLIRDDGTSLGVGVAPSGLYQLSMSTSTLTNSVTVTNSTNTASLSTGMTVNAFGNLGDKVGIQAIGNTIDTDNVSVGLVAVAQGASFNTVSNRQYGMISAVDGNQGFTHDSVGLEVQADDSHAGNNYGIILDIANAGSGTSYIGMFDDGRTTGADKFLKSIDANGTVEWADLPPIGSVDSVNGATGIVVLDTDDIAEGVGATNLWFTQERARLSFEGGDGIIIATATGVISADIQDSSTASTTALWSANKIWTEVETAKKDSWVWSASSRRANTTDTYLAVAGGANSNQSPYIAFEDCKLTNISVATTTSETWVAEVRVNGTVAASYSVVSRDSDRATIDIDINAGDKISFYCLGNNISRPNITVKAKTR
jgi:hypothetical protein